MIKNPWLLPEGIEEILPQEAQSIEQLRRCVLDAYQRWGYDLVMTPMIEFIDSILGNLGEDLNLKTFKITDQNTGKTMGIRADITPQVARMDVHGLSTEGVNRLCYAGTVLHTRSDAFANTRSPLQVGCELFGHSGLESDLEIIQLMFETLRQANVPSVTLDLGHVGVFKALSEQAELNSSQEETFFDLLQRKSVPEIDEWLNQQNDLSSVSRHNLRVLVDLNGSPKLLEAVNTQLQDCPHVINEYIQKLSKLVNHLSELYPDVSINIDLAELHGYHYKTGVVFAAYALGSGQEIARGGRYDGIGKAFGSNRPATGFSADLKTLLRMGQFTPNTYKKIYAPNEDSIELNKLIQQLRAGGNSVIISLDNALDVDSILSSGHAVIQNTSGCWQVTNQ